MSDFVIIFGFALLGGLLAYFLRQPVVIGYLLAGLVIGPNALGLVEDLELVETMASVGVVLLMFTIGMEFSLGELKRVGRVGLGGGIAQVIITALAGFAIGRNLFNFAFSDALFFGFVISLSSTMIVFKTLMERGESNSPHGKIMIAILLVQDLCALPLMVILPALGQQQEHLLFNLGITLGRAALVLGGMAVVGLWAIPRVLGLAGTRSREIFMMAVLAIGLGAAFSTTYFGVSAAFGAFAAGMLVGRSHFSHQAQAEIIPLRNGFAALFFVSLGMLTSPGFIAQNWPTVLFVTLTIVITKYIICSAVAGSFGYSTKTILFVGAGLIPVGEFSFILAKAGMDSGVVSEYLYSLILSSAIVTIFLTPILINLTAAGYGRLSRSRILRSLADQGSDESLAEVKERLSGHVVICGYGRVGSNLASTLDNYTIPYLVIELNPHVAEEVRARGRPSIYGDAGNPHILDLAGVERAKVLAVTCPDPMALSSAVSYARRVNPQMTILARAIDPVLNERLEKAGVTELVEPEFETSLEFVRHTLQTFEVDTAEVDKLVCTDLRLLAKAEKEKKRSGEKSPGRRPGKR